jgi:hypothetical protein
MLPESPLKLPESVIASAAKQSSLATFQPRQRIVRSAPFAPPPLAGLLRFARNDDVADILA